MNNAEPIEIITTLVSFMAVLICAAMAWRAFTLWLATGHQRKCEAVRLLAWIRVRNSGKDLGLSILILIVGLVTATTPAPLNPGPFRHFFQTAWLFMVGWTLIASVANARDGSKVVDIIETERAEREEGTHP